MSSCRHHIMRDRADIIDEICDLLDVFDERALTTEELLDFALLLRCFSHPAREPLGRSTPRPILRLVE